MCCRAGQRTVSARFRISGISSVKRPIGRECKRVIQYLMSFDLTLFLAASNRQISRLPPANRMRCSIMSRLLRALDDALQSDSVAKVFDLERWHDAGQLKADIA